ncbi:hypothetical protein MACH23_34320 [Sulfitobacter pontiacus]|nr:hypothetical protein MACH23_34320 [Sulfitobacter pontiacus]
MRDYAPDGIRVVRRQAQGDMSATPGPEHKSLSTGQLVDDICCVIRLRIDIECSSKLPA